MIRPITFICFLLALGSGLYLYQSKHTAQMLDHTIEKTARDTDAVREQTRALKTEWTLLNEPDRLRQLAEQYLPALKPLAPTQFTTLADLNSRLPAPQAIAPEPAPVAEAPAVAAADQAAPAGAVMADLSPADASPTDAADAMPVPPIPPPAPVAVPSATAQVASVQPAPVPASATPARMPDRKPAAPAPRPVALAAPSPRAAPPEPRPSEARTAETRPAETRTAEARPVELRGPEQPRLTDYRTLSAPRAARPAPMPPSGGGGSLLGMARGPDNLPPPLPMPMPRPTPVNAFSSSWPNGG